MTFHTTKHFAFWNDAPGIYFLVFFILVFSGFFPHVLCLRFVWVFIYTIHQVPLKPNCWPIVRGWLVILDFVFLLFSVWFGLLRGVLLEGHFAVAMSFFFFKFALLTDVFFQLNFSITKIFSLAKGNLFYEICYVT